MALTYASHGKARDTATIANGQTVSGAVDLNDLVFAGFMTPAAFTGTAVTFQGSVDGANYAQICDDTGTALSVTVTTSKSYSINPIYFLGYTHIKLVSGSSEAAARDLTVFATRALNRY